MISTISSIALCVGLALGAPQLPRDSALVGSATKFSLSQFSTDAAARAAAIAIKRSTFNYSPSPIGNINYYPNGTLATTIINGHVADLNADLVETKKRIATDQPLSVAAIIGGGGLNTLADYENIYNGQWKNAIPDGPAAGILSNYTNDLLFSMERLSVNPYSIKRLVPGVDNPAFEVVDAPKVAYGYSLDALLWSGCLFYVDYRDQALLAPSPGKFAAATDAFFYIHPSSGDFLPLAIRSDNASMIYTPADTAKDWLLAKMMFNANDVWFAQWQHFASTHFILEIAFEAAFRTFSDSHPVLALLDHLSPEIFSFGVLYQSTLAPAGGYIELATAHTGAAATRQAELLYNDKSGKFQSNYFLEDLKGRNLISCSFGPELKSFPYLDDAGAIHDGIEAFMTTFVDSYYANAAAFNADKELLAWITEAVPAKIQDFPTTVDRETLINILTHFAFLGGVVHHTLNNNEMVDVTAVLPFHPLSLSQAPPTAKGVTNVAAYLPSVSTAVTQVIFGALFSRPQLFNSDRSLTHMFSNATFLAKTNVKTTMAATQFQTLMEAHSAKVQARKFDVNGLSQGMPFIWKALDPKRIPFELME